MSFNPLPRLSTRAFERVSPSLIFVLVWLVLPNLSFASLWVTGGPIRTLAIILYLLIGLLARRLPFAVVASLFLLTVLFDVLFVLSNVFNLSVVSFLYAIEYAWTLRPFASATYVLFGGALIASSVTVLWLARRLRNRFPDASIAVIALSAGGIMAVDTTINLTPEYSFGQILSQAAPFDSAVRRSGLLDGDNGGVTGDPKRNLLIVMVESWGHLKDPAQRALVEAPFQRTAVTERYTMTAGVTPYYGSTTSGELRELCGEWGSYRDYMKRPADGCLPARLGEAGYHTIAIHGFAARMFDRDRWYPNIGFQDMRFADELWQPGERICPGVFTGACDTDIAEDVGRALASANGEPQLVYWLTLNSHLPVHPDSEKRFLDCETSSRPFQSEQVCRLAELWIQVFDRLADILAAPRIPPTDVLIVGDHAPPFWSHAGRSHFTPGEVPWILLRAREGA